MFYFFKTIIKHFGVANTVQISPVSVKHFIYSIREVAIFFYFLILDCVVLVIDYLLSICKAFQYLSSSSWQQSFIKSMFWSVIKSFSFRIFNLCVSFKIGALFGKNLVILISFCDCYIGLFYNCNYINQSIENIFSDNNVHYSVKITQLILIYNDKYTYTLIWVILKLTVVWVILDLTVLTYSSWCIIRGCY